MNGGALTDDSRIVGYPEIDAFKKADFRVVRYPGTIQTEHMGDMATSRTCGLGPLGCPGTYHGKVKHACRCTQPALPGSVFTLAAGNHWTLDTLSTITGVE
jgi:hypothetical protein